ncbi:MAG: DMT family transporter [Planctomycetaceae bacterium]
MNPKSSQPAVEANPSAIHPLWPDASLIGVALIWGINLPLMKIGLEQMDRFTFNAIRLVISAFALGAFAWYERRRSTKPQIGIHRRELWTYSLIVSALYQLAFLLGVSRTSAGNAALIIATVPMWTAILSRLFLGERLRMLAWGGLLIALIGTITVALQTGDATIKVSYLLGNLLMLLAALLWAGGTVYSRKLLHRISPMQLSSTAAFLALPVHILTALMVFPGGEVELRSANLWLILFYSGVLSTGLALPMWNFGVRQAGSAHAAIIQNMVPLVAIIAAWAIRGEVITGPQIVGGILILSGIITMRFTRRAEPTPIPPPAQTIRQGDSL